MDDQPVGRDGTEAVVPVVSNTAFGHIFIINRDHGDMIHRKHVMTVFDQDMDDLPGVVRSQDHPVDT